jgi:hypothetical protein
MLPSEEAPERRDNSVISGGNKKSYSYTASHDQALEHGTSLRWILVPMCMYSLRDPCSIVWDHVRNSLQALMVVR